MCKHDFDSLGKDIKINSLKTLVRRLYKSSKRKNLTTEDVGGFLQKEILTYLTK
jgi:hypothetical protein